MNEIQDSLLLKVLTAHLNRGAKAGFIPNWSVVHYLKINF
jgi:hypothetical protein